jgi:hypothetical protein
VVGSILNEAVDVHKAQNASAEPHDPFRHSTRQAFAKLQLEAARVRAFYSLQYSSTALKVYLSASPTHILLGTSCSTCCFHVCCSTFYRHSTCAESFYHHSYEPTCRRLSKTSPSGGHNAQGRGSGDSTFPWYVLWSLRTTSGCEG